MAANDAGAGLSIEELRQRYEIEQRKRLRSDGMAQWSELSEELDRDPFVEPGFTRAPVVEEVTAVIVGGGFAGMLTAIDLGRRYDQNAIVFAGDDAVPHLLLLPGSLHRRLCVSEHHPMEQLPGTQ